MNTNWCPVRLVTSDLKLQVAVESLCNELHVKDIKTIRSFDDLNRRETPLAFVLLLDLVEGRPVSGLESELFGLLQHDPKNVVVGIGPGLPGNLIARWAKQGMNGYVDKPIDQNVLSNVLVQANQDCIRLRIAQSEFRLLQTQRTSITKREEEVLQMVIQGIPNKCIATRLDVSQRTIETRRQKIYRKMNANRLADLIRSLDKLDNLSQFLSVDH